MANTVEHAIARLRQLARAQVETQMIIHKVRAYTNEEEIVAVVESLVADWLNERIDLEVWRAKLEEP